MEAIILDREGLFRVPLAHIYGQSIDIMGLKRTGKSNSGFVLMEGWLDAGHPLTFVDPHNEGWGLKVTSEGKESPYQILVAGCGRRADIPLNSEHAADLAEFSYKNRVSVVLSLLRIPQEERFAILNAYFERLFALALQAYENEDVHNYGIALEEAPTYLPQIGTTPVKPVLKQIVQEGGKFGFTTFLITQRSQDLDKSILSQAETYVLHKVLHPRDKEVYRGIIPESSEKVGQRIADLKNQGDAIVVHRGEVHAVHIKPQATYHVGTTPGGGNRAIHPVSSLDAAMLDELRTLMTSALPEDPVQEEIKLLLQQIKTLEMAINEGEQQHNEVIKAKDGEIQELRTQLDIARMVHQALDGNGFLRGDSSGTVFCLDSLSTSVEYATIDVAQLSPRIDASSGEALPPLSLGAFVRRVQQLEADNARLQEELVRKSSVQEGDHQLVSNDALPSIVGGETAAEVTVDPLEQLLFSEKKLLKKLIEQIMSLSPSEKALFTWLIEHDGKEVSSQQLADGVSMDIGVTWTRSTRKLVKIPFIRRWGTNKFYFKADFAVYARKYFSNQRVIIQKLVKAAQM